jgi:hypothetical protein
MLSAEHRSGIGSPRSDGLMGGSAEQGADVVCVQGGAEGVAIVHDIGEQVGLPVRQGQHLLLDGVLGDQAVPGRAGPVDRLGPAAAPLVEEIVADFRLRWARVLAITPGVRRHHVDSADIAAAAAEQFPAAPAAWSTAIQHSPDLMIAAADADAVDRGEFLLVLGELHMALNTIESRLFVEQH